MISVVPLKWDSDFFKLRIAKIEIESHDDAQSLLLEGPVLKKEYDLIYVFSTISVPVFEDQMQLVDKKAYYISDLNVLFADQPLVKHWSSSHISPDLLHLALLSGEYSRFNLDKRFSPGSYIKLYSHWIQQSVNRSYATDVFCYMCGEKPRGLLTLSIQGNVGTIGLVSVDERFRQKGIGSSMIRHAMNYSLLHQVNKLCVTTQSRNIPACRLYEKNGFRLDSVVDVWHWWL